MSDGPSDIRQQPRLSGLTLASVASIGAGAVHAAAAGIHTDHVGLTRLFVLAAAAQIAVGVAGLARRHALLPVAIAATNGVAVAGWLATRLTGIDTIDGLATRESPQFADTACAALGALAVVLAALALRRNRAGVAEPPLALSSLAVTALVVPAMFSVTSHVHSGTDDHAHDDTDLAGETTDAHGHDTTDTTATDHVDDTHDVVPVPYDPTQPIDLSGTPGVSPEQQAAAENLIAVTLRYLPQWADHRDAEAAGFRSIGDGGTGHEHFIQWDWIDDDVSLDPNYPESLVYEPQPDGSRLLVSAMFMLPPDVALADVPDIGGELMQWHIHDDLCFTDGDAPQVQGLVRPDGSCPAGLRHFEPSPMIHVWITPHPCGPFAALEGVGAGQIVEGEERLCDHQHGTGLGG